MFCKSVSRVQLVMYLYDFTMYQGTLQLTPYPMFSKSSIKYTCKENLLIMKTWQTRLLVSNYCVVCFSWLAIYDLSVNVL